MMSADVIYNHWSSRLCPHARTGSEPHSIDLRHMADDPLQSFAIGAEYKLVDEGKADIIAVTLGMDGAVIASHERAIRVVAPKVETRSAVGAGDSFVAGMTVALLDGRSIEDAALLGTAAGAAAALNPGTGVCAFADIMRLYEALREDAACVERLQ